MWALFEGHGGRGKTTDGTVRVSTHVYGASIFVAWRTPRSVDNGFCLQVVCRRVGLNEAVHTADFCEGSAFPM